MTVWGSHTPQPLVEDYYRRVQSVLPQMLMLLMLLMLAERRVTYRRPRSGLPLQHRRPQSGLPRTEDADRRVKSVRRLSRRWPGDGL